MSAKSPTLRLCRQFGWLMLAAAVSLFSGVLFLGLHEFGNARAAILKDIENAQLQRRVGLEQIADFVDTHIDTMRAFIAQNLVREAALPEHAGRRIGLRKSANPAPNRGWSWAIPPR